MASRPKKNMPKAETAAPDKIIRFNIAVILRKKP